MQNISTHWTKDRQERQHIIKLLGGIGQPLFSIEIDRGHPAGPEIHTITDNGIIIVKNALSQKMVTMMIARPAQLLKYGKPIPQKVLNIAKAHQQAGFNN